MQKDKIRKVVSPAAYARSRGLNRSTISRQIREGKIPTIQGMIDPDVADLARQTNLDAAKCGDEALRKAQRDATKRAATVPAAVPAAVPTVVQHDGALGAH